MMQLHFAGEGDGTQIASLYDSGVDTVPEWV
jgi:hypothetical protein